ncbi:MAG TPA: AraC family transcriptional regulator [Candidatus Angelobacter sp.]
MWTSRTSPASPGNWKARKSSWRNRHRSKLEIPRTHSAPALFRFAKRFRGEIFRHEFGEILGDYLNCIRVRAAVDRLANSDLPLSTIALDFGFYDQSHFTRIFRQFAGATPGVFRADYTSHKTPVAALS